MTHSVASSSGFDLSTALADRQARVVTHIEDPDALTLVCFSGWDDTAGLPAFEFHKSTRDLPGNRVYVRDPNNLWYHVPDGETPFEDLLAEALAPLRPEQLVFLGNSSGGYAALRFGAQFDAGRMLAFSPQTFLSRELCERYRDDRLKEIREAMWARIPDGDSLDLCLPVWRWAGRADVWFPVLIREDIVQAARLTARRNVHLHPTVSRDHSVVRRLRRTGELRQVLEDALGVV